MLSSVNPIRLVTLSNIAIAILAFSLLLPNFAIAKNVALNPFAYILCIVEEPETAPLSYLVRYLPSVLKKKTKVIDIFYTDKKCFIKFNVD